MLGLDEQCASCTGTGKDPHHRTTVAMLLDGSSWDPASLHPQETLDMTRDAEPPLQCHSCHGMRAPDGLTYARYRDDFSTYGDPYKTASTLKAGLTRGTAKVCKSCRGSGFIMYLPAVKDCYSCSGRGTRVSWNADVDPILPPSVGRTESVTDAFVSAWWKSVRIAVLRPTRDISWGESHLGLGTLVSCTDYGRTWEQDEAYAVTQVRESLSRHPGQFVSYIDAQRRVGTFLVIAVHRNGYTARIAEAERITPMLPPSYYPRVWQEL